MTHDELLDALWRDYTAITPQAEQIHALLRARGERIINDHVALRTLGTPTLGLEVMARPFLALGWEPRDVYRFEDKHLVARYYRHADPSLPKVFISELVLEELGERSRALLAGLVAQVPEGFSTRADLPWSGRPWHLPQATYRALLEESEYAAWVAAFGFRVNHFTVDVNRLASVASLQALTAVLIDAGFAMNTAGGLIKGSPAELLEQASTMAGAVDVTFEDGVARVPSCYTEFARRYPLPGGELFQGFVPTSATKLFESTNARR